MPMFLILLSFVGGPDKAHQKHQLSARKWFNNPEYRLNDKRDVILFFFSTRDRDSERIAGILNRIHRRPDTIVIGLTRDTPNLVEKFIRRKHVRFTVGALSDAARSFGVKRFPAILRVSGSDHRSVEKVDSDQINAMALDWGEYGDEDLDSLTEVWELAAFAESNASGIVRGTAAFRLRDEVGAEAFADFARDQLAFEGDPWMRNTLEYLLTDPTPEEIKAQKTAPSALYAQTYKADPSAPEFAAARTYLQTPFSERPAKEMIKDYWEHLSGEPDATLIRSWIASMLNPGEGEVRSDVRKALFDMISSEPDLGIRHSLVSKLVLQACDTGDTEAADFLDARAAAETNVLFVKPLLQAGSYFLRTGKQDTRDMPPPTDDPRGK